MAKPEIKFVGPEYDGAEAQLGTLQEKLGHIITDIACDQYGKENALEPTDIEIAPTAIEDDSYFVVNAWHETASAEGRVGVLQPFSGSFDLVVDYKDGYLHHRIDNGVNYLITTAEAIALSKLMGLAAVHETIRTPIDQESL